MKNKYTKLSKKFQNPMENRAVVVVVVWYLELQLPMQWVPTIAHVVSSNPTHGELHNIVW
jgi:hypothetical protein